MDGGGLDGRYGMGRHPGYECSLCGHWFASITCFDDHKASGVCRVDDFVYDARYGLIRPELARKLELIRTVQALRRRIARLSRMIGGDECQLRGML